MQGILPSYSLPRVVWSVLDVSAYTGAERGPHEQPDPKSILFAYHYTHGIPYTLPNFVSIQVSLLYTIYFAFVYAHNLAFGGPNI